MKRPLRVKEDPPACDREGYALLAHDGSSRLPFHHHRRGHAARLGSGDVEDQRGQTERVCNPVFHENIERLAARVLDHRPEHGGSCSLLKEVSRAARRTELKLLGDADLNLEAALNPAEVVLVTA